MSATNGNGHAPAPSREQIQEARRRVHFARANVELQRLDAIAKLTKQTLTESIPNFTAEIIASRMAEWGADRGDWYGYFTSRRNRHGNYFPLFITEQEHAAMRFQARWLCATNSYAIGLLEGMTSYMLGDGIGYRVAARNIKRPVKEVVDAVQNIVDEFLDDNCWYGGLQPSMERELFQRSLIDGEFIVLHTTDKDGRVKLRIVDPEQMTQPAGTGPEWTWGIRHPYDAETEFEDVQTHLEYWFYWGESRERGKAYPAEQVTHYRRNVPRNVKRGLSDFSGDTADILKIAAKLRENMGSGAAMQAAIAGVRQHDSSTRAEVESMADRVAHFTTTNPIAGSDSTNKEYHAPVHAHIADVPKGLNWVTPPNAQNASAHVEILQACLRGAGRRFCATEWLSSGDSSNSNYASSLTADSQFVKYLSGQQRQYEQVFVRSPWIAVEQRIKAQGGLRVKEKIEGQEGRFAEKTYSWEQVKLLVDIQAEAPSPEAVDKLVQAQQNQIYSTLGAKSVQTIQGELGLDTEQEFINIEEYKERMGGGDQGGLPMPAEDGSMGGDEQGGAAAQGGGFEMPPPPPEEAMGEALTEGLIEVPDDFWASLYETSRRAFSDSRPLQEAVAPQPQPVTVNAPVTVNLPEPNNVVNVPAQNVTVQPAPVHNVVNVPEAKQPNVTNVISTPAAKTPIIKNVINVPKQPPAEVNVEVKTPKLRRSRKKVERDSKDNITETVEDHEYEGDK